MNNANALDLLQDIMREQHQNRYPQKDFAKFFEYFVAEQVLKSHMLNFDEIKSGIPDKKDMDGGIDGIFLFCNGAFIAGGTDIKNSWGNTALRILNYILYNVNPL